MMKNECPSIPQRRILVTGGGRRVGRAISLSLAETGARLAIHYHGHRQDAERTASDAREAGSTEAWIVGGDLSRKAEWEHIRDVMMDRWGGLDTVIHNAAIFSPTPFSETTEADWDLFMAINCKSLFFGAQVLAPMLRESEDGVIIAIADVAGESIWPGYIPYSVSKAGALALVRGLAKLLAPDIRVNAVSPGPVLLPDGASETDRVHLQRTVPLGRIGQPEDVANVVRYLLDASFVTGQNFRVDGGRSLLG